MFAKDQEENAAIDATGIVTGGRREATEIEGTIEEPKKEITQILQRIITIMRIILTTTTTTKFCRRQIQITHRA